MSAETIKVVEVTRNTSGGRYTYASYRSRTVRREARRGRPHYEVVGGLTIQASEKPHTREINVNSQLGRALLVTA